VKLAYDWYYKAKDSRVREDVAVFRQPELGSGSHNDWILVR